MAHRKFIALRTAERAPSTGGVLIRACWGVVIHLRKRER